MKKYLSIFTFLFLSVSKLMAAHDGVARALNFGSPDEAYAILTGIDTGGDAIAGLQSLFAFKDFNPSKDKNIVRASFAGFLTRKAFIKLSDEQFTNVVSHCLPFFSTPYGFSLIHGWMLNKFRESTTPYYIGTYFSFDKFFWGMVNAMPATVSADAKGIIKRAWWSARAEIEANRWAYYDNMLYLPYAIEKAGVAKAVPAPTIDRVIADSRTTPASWFKKSTLEFRAAMKTRINAFLSSRTLASTDNPQELFSDIMAWVLAHHIDLRTDILPGAVTAANFNVTKFVNFITDRAFTLYEDKVATPNEKTKLADVRSVDMEVRSADINVAGLPSEQAGRMYKDNIAGLQFGQALQMYLDALLRSISATISDRDQYKDLIFATVKEAIGKAKRAKVVSASLITLSADEVAAFSAPDSVIRITELNLSPVRGSRLGAKAIPGLFADESYLGNLGVYFTPVEWVGTNLMRCGKFELADILKTFESYLIKQKAEMDKEFYEDRGVGVGTGVFDSSKTCLAEIRGWRYKLLSPNGDVAVDGARAFITSDRGRDRFKTSMSKKRPA